MSAVIGSMAKKGSLKKKTSSVVVAAKGIKKRVLKKPAAKGCAQFDLYIHNTFHVVRVCFLSYLFMFSYMDKFIN